MLFHLVWIFAALTLASQSTVAAPHKVVGFNYPPYVYISENGKSKGTFVDTAMEITRRLKLRSKRVHVLPPRRSNIGVLDDSQVILLSSRIIFPEAEHRKLIFIKVFDFDVVMFGKKSKTSGIKSLSQLENRKVAILSGDHFERQLASDNRALATEVNSVEQMMRMVFNDRVDFGFCLPQTCQAVLDKDFPGRGSEIDTSTHRVLTATGDIILKKTARNMKLAEEIQKVLRDLEAEGFLAKKFTY